jgi:hypothetical protein
LPLSVGGGAGGGGGVGDGKRRPKNSNNTDKNDFDPLIILPAMSNDKAIFYLSFVHLSFSIQS